MNIDQSYSPSKSLTDWTNEPTLEQLKRDYTDARTEADNQVSKVDTWLDNLHIKGKTKLPKQKTAYEIRLSLVGSEMCIRDRFIPV